MILLFLSMIACQPDEPTPLLDTPNQQETILKTSQEGPITATVEVSPKDLRLGDPLQLRLSVDSEVNVDVELPPFGEAIGRFQISDFKPRSTTNEDGSQKNTQTYTLQAPMSGLQRIPSLRIVYTDRRNGQTEERELLTEEIAIEIAGLLEKDAPLDFKPARSNLQPKIDVPIWVWLSGGSVLLFGGLWFARKRYLSWQQAEIVRSAYQKAIDALLRLEQNNFENNIDHFYVELSMIVRRYIDARYGLQAPELTTEEFFARTKSQDLFSATHQEFLRDFLNRCDMVKFAQAQPPAEEGEQEIRGVRRFLEETRPQEEAS